MSAISISRPVKLTLRRSSGASLKEGHLVTFFGELGQAMALWGRWKWSWVEFQAISLQVPMLNAYVSALRGVTIF